MFEPKAYARPTSPTMISGMPFFDRYERALAGIAELAAGPELPFHRRPIFRGRHDPRLQGDGPIGGRGPLQDDGVVRGHGAGRRLGTGLVHEVPGGGPVAVA